MEESNIAMWIVRDSDAGAGAIIKAQKELKERFKHGYYVIPSSVDDMIVIPKYPWIDKDSIKGLISEVNNSELPTSKILSDTLYEF
jgi:hypothetical protein